MASSSSCKLREEHSPDEDGDQYDHDVFINFRGPDTRSNFTAHVHAALHRKQILAFIDSEDLITGHEIAGSLLRAIQVSNMYLVIFSPDYGSSPWCLMELEKILQYRREHGKTVIPVFYKVDPSCVRHQIGSFQDAFAKHEARREKHKVQSWRSALQEAASISGLHSSDYRSEIELIDRIVEVILKELTNQTPSLTNRKNLVGIDSHVEEVMSMLRMDSPQVRSVGIWGMGGIGKTTIAEVVLDYLQKQFDGSHFFEEVREEVKRSNKSEFWSKVLSKILGEKDLSLNDSFVRKRLRRKRVFIVFDDVDESMLLMLEDLAKHRELFGTGSRILMTSRDKHVLNILGVDEVYEAVRLKYKESLKLLSLNAFKQESPPNAAYAELSKKVVDYTQGNPLALKVLGSSFLGRNEEYWISALDKMEKFPKEPILDILRISYDALSREEKDIFLDIACVSRYEDEKHVRGWLECVYGCAGSIITNLVDKSLISICPRFKQIRMHDLVQEMSQRIADQESPGKRIRLHHVEDICQVFTQKKGREAIDGIILDLRAATRRVSFKAGAFREMVNLRWLIVEGMFDVQIFGNDQVFLPRLTYLHWRCFTMKSFSSAFHAPNLVKLSLPFSNIERLWSGVQDVVNLRWMDLSGCGQLREIPDFSMAKKLESIDLTGCCSLIRVHPSVQYLYKLQVLNLMSCGKLREIPSRFESKDLRVFDLYDCRQIKECPEIYVNKLEELCLSGTEIKEIPNSIGLFQCLRRLGLHFCPNMTKFPKIPSSLEFLEMSHLSIEEVSSSLRFLQRLKHLILLGNHSLTHIPELPLSLRTLKVLDCKSLQTVSSISTESQLKHLEFINCNKLEDAARANIIHYTFFKLLQMDEDIYTVVAGSEIPDWFRHQSTGSSVTLQLPSHLYKDSKSFKGIAFCAAVKYKMDEDSSISGFHRLLLGIPSDGKDVPLRNEPDELTDFDVDVPSIIYQGQLTDSLVLWSQITDSQMEDMRRVLSRNYDSHISFHFRIPYPLSCNEVTKCGVNLIYG